MWIIYSASTGRELDSTEHKHDADRICRRHSRDLENEYITMRWENR